MEIHLPDEIKHYEPELRFVLDLMVRKLHVNRHKGLVENYSVASIASAILAENRELDHEVLEGSQFAAAVEAADLANCGVLMAIKLLRMTRPEFDQIGAARRDAMKENRPVTPDGSKSHAE